MRLERFGKRTQEVGSRMAVCTFCGEEIHKGTGKMFVRDNGQVLNFCSMKCEKNMLVLKRDARKLKWTKFYEKGEAAPAKSEKKTDSKKVEKKTVKKSTAKKNEKKK